MRTEGRWAGLRCLKLRHGNWRDTTQRNHQGNSRSWKFKEEPWQCSPFSGEPITPFWKSRALLQLKEKGAEKIGSRGQRGEENLYCVSLNRENTQAPGTQITDNCWKNASLPSLSSILVIPGGTRTGKLPMIGFIRAIFRKMSEVNSSAIIPPQGSNNHYQECKWVKKKKKKNEAGELWLWPLTEVHSEDCVHVRKAKGKQWAGKLRQLPLNNSNLKSYFNIIISGFSLYARLIQVSSVKFSTLLLTVLFHTWKCFKWSFFVQKEKG